MLNHLRAMECHLPYGITSDTGEHAPARHGGTWFTYPRGMEGWVNL